MAPWYGKRHCFVLGIAVLLCLSAPAKGQFDNVISALFGSGSTTPSTPASPTVISTTSPSPTPVATPAATPAATSTPNPEATTAAATAATAAAPASTATAASPEEATPAATPAETPAARVTPTATRRAVTAPPPPAPVPAVIDPSKLVPALPADQTVAAPTAAPSLPGEGITNPDITAVDTVLRVSGPGVTPFVIPQQTVLLRAMASVMTTVSLRDLRIRYVTSAANSRRRLLAEDPQLRRGLLADAPSADGQLYNVASVTLGANCSSNTGAAATLAEIQSVINNDLLASAIQSYGQPQWGVQMLSLTAVNPNVALTTGASCRKKLGTFCLDNTSLSVAAVQVIIAIGCVAVVMLLAIPCVLLEWRRKSGQAVELDPTPQTPKTPLARVQLMYNKLIDSVKAASPMHRRGSSDGRNAFRSDTPVSAKADKGQSGAVDITATPAK